MIRVNLVPAEILAKARQRQLVLQLSVVGAALAAILIAVSVGHWLSLLRVKNDYSYKESKLKKLSAIVAQVEELEKAAASVRARLGVIEGLLKGRAFYPIFMSEFAKTVPAGVRVTQMNTALQSGGALKLSVSASSQSNEELAGWVKTLEKAPHFSAVELGAISAGTARQYTFTIVAIYTNNL